MSGYLAMPRIYIWCTEPESQRPAAVPIRRLFSNHLMAREVVVMKTMEFHVVWGENLQRLGLSLTLELWWCLIRVLSLHFRGLLSCEKVWFLVITSTQEQ